MKALRLSLCLTALMLAFSAPAPAADQVQTPATKKRPPAREVKKPVPKAVRAPVATAELVPEASISADPDQSGQIVYEVLLAETALQRGDLDFASQAYDDLAKRTRDPKVFERAVAVAGFARRFDLALEIARRWAEVDPSSKQAQQVLASVMILSNQLDGLAPGLVRMLESDKASLPDNLMGLNRMLARNPDRVAVFQLIEKVCRPFFAYPEAHYAVAMAAGSAGASERALAETRRALELRPDWEKAAILQAQLLAASAPAEAVSFLEGFVERNPSARDAELVLARLLVADRRYADAKRYFDHLLQAYPDNPDVVYPVAILALQQNDRVLAEAQLKHFVTLPVVDKSYAYYYLGQICEDEKRVSEALAHYSRVKPGDRYLPAQLRSAHLLADQGKLEAARQQLRDATASNADERLRLTIAEAGLVRDAKQPQAAFDLLEPLLAAQPDQPDLLYETALLAERIGRNDLLESRLRKLIELRPDNAQAYNALGYSYAERNERLSEARELIEKALKLAPADSFILDSMGWVLFRQGDYAGALAYLEQAYALRDDPEIAAHLSEVLWTLGRRDDAIRTLREALSKHPKNEALAEVAKKLPF